MKVLGLKSCDTCRRARRELAAAGRTFAFVDVRDDPVPEEVLTQAFAAFGAALVNRRSTTWKTLSPAERAVDPLDLLRRHPAVMKRPLIVDGKRFWLGWDAAVRGELLG